MSSRIQRLSKCGVAPVNDHQVKTCCGFGSIEQDQNHLSRLMSVPVSCFTCSGVDAPPPLRQALAEVTAALQEKLLRWQQIESLTGFCVVSNPGLVALAAALNLDPSFLGLRPPTPQNLLLSDDLDDMDEDILSPGTLQCESGCAATPPGADQEQQHAVIRTNQLIS